MVSDAWAAPSGCSLAITNARGGKKENLLTPTHSFFKNERDVLPAGEAAQPLEAHHAEDGDLLGSRRARWPHKHPGPHVAHSAKYQGRLSPCVPLGSANEGHRVQEEVTDVAGAPSHRVIYLYSTSCMEMYKQMLLLKDTCSPYWVAQHITVSSILPFHSLLSNVADNIYTRVILWSHCTLMECCRCIGRFCHVALCSEHDSWFNLFTSKDQADFLEVLLQCRFWSICQLRLTESQWGCIE